MLWSIFSSLSICNLCQIRPFFPIKKINRVIWDNIWSYKIAS
jgi:hypothetical protein